jgi:hypothetical protein
MLANKKLTNHSCGIAPLAAPPHNSNVPMSVFKIPLGSK